MNKKTIRIAGWALGLSMAVAGVGVAVGTSFVARNEPLVANAAEGDNHDFEQDISAGLNNNATITSINIAAQPYPIKEIRITCRYNKNTNPAVTISASVGGASVGSTITVGSNFNGTKVFDLSDNPLSGPVVISFANNTGNGTGHGTFWVTNVRLVEGPAAAVNKPIGSITNVALNYNSVPVNFSDDITATATFAPNDTDEIIRWESSNKNVATIEASSTNGVGRINIVGTGTCYFTASNTDESIKCNSGNFEVTEKQLLSTIRIVKSSLKMNDSSQPSTYDKYKGAQEADGLDLDVTAVMPNTNDAVEVVQMQKNNGIIKNTAAFTFGAKMIRLSGTGTPSVNFAVDDTASSASDSSNSVHLGDSYFFVPKNLASDAQYFYVKQTNADTGYYSSITILSEQSAARAFAEMYLGAYSCDSTGGSSTVLNSGYSIENMGTLYEALDSGVRKILSDAVKDHNETYGEDVIKEFGQRYYLINHNHGTTHDFMSLNGTVSFAASANMFGVAAESDSNIIFYTAVIAGGVVAAGGLYIASRKRKSKED